MHFMYFSWQSNKHTIHHGTLFVPIAATVCYRQYSGQSTKVNWYSATWKKHLRRERKRHKWYSLNWMNGCTFPPLADWTDLGLIPDRKTLLKWEQEAYISPQLINSGHRLFYWTNKISITTIHIHTYVVQDYGCLSLTVYQRADTAPRRILSGVLEMQQKYQTAIMWEGSLSHDWSMQEL